MDTLTFELKVADDSGTFEGIMSAPVLDRDNEIVDSGCFAPLPKHITIDIDHGLTVEKTVGSGEPYYDTDGLLKVKGTFASTPLGQLTRTLVKEGHIRHMSVAFRNPVRELDQESGITHVRKGELINCTITGIPANTATALIAKVGARNSAKDAERIQATHDHMVDLGATCEAKCAHGVDPKSPNGNGIRYSTPNQGDPHIVRELSGNNISTGNASFTAGGVVTYLGSNYAPPKGISEWTPNIRSADTEPPPAAALEAAPAGAEVDVVRALAKLTLARAALALE